MMPPRSRPTDRDVLADLRECARNHLPICCLAHPGVEVKHLRGGNFEVSAAVPFESAAKVDYSQPRAAMIARAIADHFERDGVLMAFWTWETLGPGFRFTFARAN